MKMSFSMVMAPGDRTRLKSRYARHCRAFLYVIIAPTAVALQNQPGFDVMQMAKVAFTE
ncbi:hypothetical protein LECLMA074M_07315 [Leclercia sp. M-A074-M]